MQLICRGCSIDIEFEWADVDEISNEIAEAAIAEAVIVTEHQFRHVLNSRRRKTRRAITATQRGNTGSVGYVFPSGQRYPKAGTRTKQLAEKAWRNAAGPAMGAIEQSISDSLTEYE